ncbi:hypothetical protein [Rugosimonospora africana]|uniref:Uncharacterized protein n=1 Tax=Rugosimonospora africana TaxID=556532 RepID=A0A8J3VRA0_9ACTN|nr:hypothetical protein [Rugosimonospora africana]GIH15909.1 hypothetical protein Raf01_40810 [Rugosimonospora africana]
MAKEKFELAFLAGGAMLDVLNKRLRRTPATPREEVGAAAYAVSRVFEEQRDQLTDADAVARQITAIREELTASRPNRYLLAGFVDELAYLVRDVAELGATVECLRTAIAGYLD